MRRPIDLRLLRPLFMLALLEPGVLRAQTTSLDEGSFRLLEAGREIGSEEFSIRQSGTGDDAVIIAQGTVVLDAAGRTGQIRPVLRVEGRSLRPAAYDLTIQDGDAKRIAGRVVGGRFSARIVSGEGEQMREYLASGGAVLVDEGVVHHHYFLARKVPSGSARIPIIIPRQNRQVSAQVTDRGPESIRVGGRDLQARHLVVTLAGAPERHLWVDDRDRVLRLEIPAQGFEAVRSSAPR